MRQILTRSATFADVLVALYWHYPSYETNLSIRSEIQNLAMLPNDHKVARITELLAELDHWVGGLTPRSYGSDEVPFLILAKVPRDVLGECRATAERKVRSLTYDDLSVLLFEQAREKESDQHLNAYRPGGGNTGNHGSGYQGPRPSE